MLEKRELYDDLGQIWRAFFELHNSRQTAFGVTPLQLTEIAAYLDIHGIVNVEERREFFELVRALDTAWMKRALEREPRKG